MPQPIFNGVILRQPMRGSAVVQVQVALRARGYTLVADGVFGPITASCVRRFQAHHGLQVDGEVGPITWAALFNQPAPPQPKKNLRLRAFDVASSLVGVMEVGGNNVGPVVSRIIQENGGLGAEPWCGDFVAYCYRHAGSKAVGKGAQRLFAYVPWMTRVIGVTQTKSPRRGDIIRYDWDGGVPDHTGLFDRWIVPGHSFASIEGNTGKDPNVSDSTSGGDGVHRRIRPVFLVEDFLHVAR